MTTDEISESDSQQLATTASMDRRTVVRCFLALVCSHACAPYASARLTIRYLLGGGVETIYAVTAGLAMAVGAVLAFRQLVNQPGGRKLLYGVTGLILWWAVSAVMLSIAGDSAIPAVVLITLWAFGTIWVAWTVWAFAFFRAGGVVVGSLAAGLGALVFWSLVEVTGLTGDAVVEFAWRRQHDRPAELVGSPSNAVASAGAVVWAGYVRDGRSSEVMDAVLDGDWETNPPQQQWRMACGKGWSSFAATETTLFGQEQLNGVDCVTARSVDTGELIWTVAETADGFVSGLGGDGPRATPTLHVEVGGNADAAVLLTVGPAGHLSCLNAVDGKVIWQTDLATEFPGENLVHGVCCSPLVVDGLVVVCPPAGGGPCMAAFRLSDGTLAWKCSSDWRASYSSPALLTIQEHPQIVVHAGPGVISVNPADGEVLWTVEWTNEWDNNATQPLQLTTAPNDIVAATGYRGGAVRFTVNKTDGGLFETSEVWNTKATMKTKFCNMAQFGNTLVGLDNGILCGIDTDTGERLWKKGRYGHGQLLKVGEHLLVLAERGDLHLLQPDESGQNVIAEVAALDRKTWNHPILIGDQLLLRNDQEILSMKLPIKASQ